MITRERIRKLKLKIKRMNRWLAPWQKKLGIHFVDDLGFRRCSCPLCRAIKYRDRRNAKKNKRTSLYMKWMEYDRYYCERIPFNPHQH